MAMIASIIVRVGGNVVYGSQSSSAKVAAFTGVQMVLGHQRAWKISVQEFYRSDDGGELMGLETG